MEGQLEVWLDLTMDRIKSTIYEEKTAFVLHYLYSQGNFYGKPLAAGSHNWLPAPLECSLADA